MKCWVASAFVLLCFFYSASGQSTPVPPTKNNFLYNATTSLLSLTRGLPMTISVHQIEEKEGNRILGKVLASVDFPDATKAKVEGSKSDGSGFTKFPVKMSIPSTMEDNNIDVTSLDVSFEMIHDYRSGYWNLSTMDISLAGKMKSNCSDVGCDLNLKDSMIVAPKKGFTNAPVDLNCQRGYTTCAPINLCWTCYDHQVAAVIEKEAKVAVSILIPGMQLQPLTANGTDKFGYRWDCDPIWSSALWFSLLLGLFLIAILAWAIEMLVTLHTPSRFDDPKGKPLVVPLTD